MLHIHTFMLATILASATLCACTTDQDPVNNGTSVTQIQSAKDLEIYLQTASNSPLDYMSSAAKQRFVSSLVFSDNGLGSFQYSDLEGLSGAQIYQILSLFGTERTSSMISKEGAPINVEPIEGDHMDYKCESIGTCMIAPGFICTSNC
jgi:hypothetical protein